jgi:hypothetical protein
MSDPSVTYCYRARDGSPLAAVARELPDMPEDTPDVVEIPVPDCQHELADGDTFLVEIQEVSYKRC